MQRTILITGANGNLGQKVIQKLSAEGHKIIAMVGSGHLPESLRQKALIQAHVDLFNEESAEAFVHSMIDQYPQLDAAILLVGGFEIGTVEATDEALLDKQIALNFKTAWFVIKPLMTHFRKSKTGQFVLICARPAINPEEGKNMVAYAISKSMLISLAEIINAEGKKMGITASVIIPSILVTPPNRKAMPDADFERWVKPSTIAETISFILSDTGKALRQPVFKVYHLS